jgi:DNA-binding CsgD family transcriptional regulator
VRNPQLIEKIYEAGACPDLWPDLLETLSDTFGARGGLLMTNTLSQVRWLASPRATDIMCRFVEEGWATPNLRMQRVFQREFTPTFFTDEDIFAVSELETLPVYQQFLIPNGVAAGSGTLVHGVDDDALVLTLEGFTSREASRAALPELNALRPHLARAAILSARVGEIQVRSALGALDAIGAAAAMLDRRGEIVEANARFRSELIDDCGLSKLPNNIAHLIDDRLHGRLRRRLARGGGLSAPLKINSLLRRSAIHLLPIKLSASDIFGGGVALAVLASGARRAVPDTDLLRMLLDLTPTEAKIAKILAEGRTTSDCEVELAIGKETVRSHVRSIYSKTGVNKQGALVALLGNLART